MLARGFCVSRKGGKGEVGKQEVGEVTRRVTCTWWLLGLALKEALFGLGGPPPALIAWTGCMTTDSADYCMLVDEWTRSKS